MSGSVEGFRESLAAEAPLSGLSAALEGLWWVGRGDWQRAHERVMAGEDPDSAWVHAHLHRIEGDLGNAAYWYRRAGRPVASGPIEAEWAAIVAALLNQSREA